MKDKSPCADCVHYKACNSWCVNRGIILKDQVVLCDIYENNKVNEPGMLERRKEMFYKLGNVLTSESIKTMSKYIIELWKYIADEHGETLCIEVDE